MYNNGDYGASFHYMYIQSSYSNSGAVSRHSYIMPYCQYYIHAHIASVSQGNKIYIFMFEYMKIYAFINITILRSRRYQEVIYHDNDKYRNIVQL